MEATMNIPESTLMRAGESRGREAARLSTFESMRRAAVREWRSSEFGLDRKLHESEQRLVDLSILLGLLREARADTWLVREITLLREQYRDEYVG
jgi:hypothetical protein